MHSWFGKGRPVNSSWRKSLGKLEDLMWVRSVATQKLYCRRLSDPYYFNSQSTIIPYHKLRWSQKKKWITAMIQTLFCNDYRRTRHKTKRQPQLCPTPKLWDRERCFGGRVQGRESVVVLTREMYGFDCSRIDNEEFLRGRVTNLFLRVYESPKKWKKDYPLCSNLNQWRSRVHSHSS